jgi:hypothetical protein
MTKNNPYFGLYQTILVPRIGQSLFISLLEISLLLSLNFSGFLQNGSGRSPKNYPTTLCWPIGPGGDTTKSQLASGLG